MHSAGQPATFIGNDPTSPATDTEKNIETASKYLPTTRSVAFELGEIVALLGSSGSKLGGLMQETSLLRRAAVLLGVPESQRLPREALKGMLAAIKMQESRRTMFQRVQGVFTLVNAIWLA